MTNTMTGSPLETAISPALARHQNRLAARALLRRAGHFMVVGLLSTLIDFSLFAVLSGWLGLPTLAANTLSYGAGIVNGYFFNRRWTFRDAPRQAAGVQFTRFAVVSLTALTLNSLVVLLLTPALKTVIAPRFAGLLAKALATGVCLGWNFLSNYCWTFRVDDPALSSLRRMPSADGTKKNRIRKDKP